MTVFHPKTDPDLPTRLKQMLSNSAHAEIALQTEFHTAPD